MRSSIAGTLAAVLGLALAVGAAREAAATEHGVCAVLDSPFTLAEIVEKAEAAVPGVGVEFASLSNAAESAIRAAIDDADRLG